MSYLSNGFQVHGVLNCETSFLEINFISIQRISSPWGVNCETNFIEINFISIWISNVKPPSLKSVSYLLETCRRPRKRMHVCVFVCLRARACLCVCVCLCWREGLFHGTWFISPTHPTHNMYIYIHIHVYIYIYIHVYTPFTPLLSGCQVKKR